jgi:hypothetical protein
LKSLIAFPNILPSTFATLIKFADALKIEMWGMFDFSHEVNIKILWPVVG